MIVGALRYLITGYSDFTLDADTIYCYFLGVSGENRNFVIINSRVDIESSFCNCELETDRVLEFQPRKSSNSTTISRFRIVGLFR